VNDSAANAGTIESFAALCALLDGSAVGRANVLANAGLDEAGWQALHARWLSRLAAGDAADAELALRFGRTYARARQRHLELSETSAIGVDAPATDVHPAYTAVQRTSVATDEPVSAMRLSCQPPAMVDPAEKTLEAPCVEPAASADPPFAAPAPVGRCQRFKCFDPEKGHRLAHPVWIDEPPSTPR
jgi:hypothetical protein